MLIPIVTPFADIGQSFVALMFDSGPFAKFILLVLFVMSVISWAIIYDRAKLYRRLRRCGQLLQAAGLKLPTNIEDRAKEFLDQ